MISRGGRRRQPRVAIIGCGLGGIATAVNLRRLGNEQFTIFERSPGPGGVWWENRYPGAECDVASDLYSFSFSPQAWSRTHARQGEIQAYLEQVLDEFDVRSHIEFDTAVVKAVWSDQDQRYELYTHDRRVGDYEVLVSAVGLFNVPAFPDVPGIDEFDGPCIHAARWQSEHDLRGKRVAVVGAGSTASQVIPAIQPDVSQLYSFQREPAWVAPKNSEDLSEPGKARSVAWRWRRFRLLMQMDDGLRTTDPMSRNMKNLDELCRRYIAAVFADQPELQEILTPKYPVRCKRMVQSDDFYPALARENVRVVPRGVAKVRGGAIVDTDGDEYEVDAIVLATGFEPWNFLSSIEVLGRRGRALSDVWDNAPEAFLGLTVPEFPNFFMVYGPNTNGGCVSFTIERQAEFIARDVRRLRRTRGTTIEVRPWMMRNYNRWVARALSGRVAWEANCHNYYHSATGKNVTQWPWTHRRYWLMTTCASVALCKGPPYRECKQE